MFSFDSTVPEPVQLPVFVPVRRHAGNVMIFMGIQAVPLPGHVVWLVNVALTGVGRVKVNEFESVTVTA